MISQPELYRARAFQCLESSDPPPFFVGAEGEKTFMFEKCRNLKQKQGNVYKHKWPNSLGNVRRNIDHSNDVFHEKGPILQSDDLNELHVES